MSKISDTIMLVFTEMLRKYILPFPKSAVRRESEEHKIYTLTLMTVPNPIQPGYSTIRFPISFYYAQLLVVTVSNHSRKIAL